MSIPLPPTDWSNFVYPPQKSAPVFSVNAQDAINVTWTTADANTDKFGSLELVLWWTAPPGGPSAMIVNETVPLNGSRVYSASYGTTYPATAWFALFYLLSNGTIVNGPGSLGFNVSSNHPQDAGRLWSEDESDTSLSSPAEETSARAVRQPAATVTTSAVPSGGVQEASRLSDGAIAGIIVGIAMTLVAVFAAVLFLMRRRWKTTRTNREVPVVPPGIYEKEQPRTLPTEVDSRQLKSELPAEKAVNLISIPHPVVRN